MCRGAAGAEVCPTKAIVIEDSDAERIMQSLSGTAVPLATCSSCKKSYAPEKLMDKVLDKLDPAIIEELRTLCPECRRKYITRMEIGRIPRS